MEVMEAADPRVAVVTALREAVSYGNVDGVRAALDSPYGADLLESRLGGQTALALCAQLCQVECAAFLLERGADVNGADNDGNTPLHEAVYRECLAMQALLQARGADLDAQNVVGATPLLWAAAFGRHAATKSLLEAGARSDVRNKKGLTPLHEACKEGEEKVVKHLLAHAADAAALDGDGNTPLHLAAAEGFPDGMFAASKQASCAKQLCAALRKTGAANDVANKDGKSPLDVAKDAHTRSRLSKLMAGHWYVGSA